MITSIFTILLLLVLIFSIFCAKKLTKTEKKDAVEENHKKIKSFYCWIIAGICTILLLWLYFSWDMTRAFYPNSANALCQGAKISQSLVAIKYILPVEEKTPEGTVFVQRENKIISNLKSEIKKTSLGDKNYLINLLNEIEIMINSLSEEKNFETNVNAKLISVSNKINILSDNIQQPDYPDYQSLSDEELEALKKQGTWGTTKMDIPYFPTTERGLKLDAAAKEMGVIMDEFFKIKNDNPIFLKKAKKIKKKIKNYKNTLQENQKIEFNYIAQISKISDKLVNGNIFPINALGEIEKAIKKFDEIQKRERGSLKMFDTWLFPAGTIVVSDSSCREQGAGKWLIKPTDAFKKFLYLFNSSERNLI